MAMFGTLGKQTTPVAAFANDPTQAAIKSPVAPAPIAPMPAIQQPKQGFYGDMPMWKVLLGTALDNIAQQTGGQGVFTQGVQMQNMQRQRAASEKARRDAEMQDWLTKQQWARDNPKPINNDTSADFEFYRAKLGDAAALRWLEGKTDPVVSIPVPGGTYLGPRSGLGSMQKGGDQQSIGSGPPQAAADYLRKNPALADQFDAKYGAGAAAAILRGGAPSQGGATFP